MRANEKCERFYPSREEGLTRKEVLLRREQGLVNVSREKITKTNAQIIRDNAFTLFNAFNLAIAVFLALAGAWTNMTYLVVIVLNVFIGIFQEIRAKKMVENLSIIGALKTTVVRDGEEREIAVEELVLDDIVILRSGNQVCADSIIESGEIEANESLLTGESDPALKRPGDSLLSGSFVVSGKCYARTENVGADNFAEKLAAGAKKRKRINSELLRSMRKVTKFTGYFIVPIGALLFLEAYFIRLDPLDVSIVSGAAGLLGMLPKGLVLITSVSLAAGVIKLSRKKILVQELHAIETLAHVDTLCLDKTGTITEGKMRVSEFYEIDADVSSLPLEKALGLFVGAVEDNNATFAALKDRFPPDYSRKSVGVTPFSSERKWSSATFEDVGTIAVGAPEVIFGGETILPDAVTEARNLGKRALGVGLARESSPGALPPGIVPIAYVILCDPVRKNVKETLDLFAREGVRVKIISGDNPATVSGVAKQAGLADFDSCVDMSEIISEDEINEAAGKYAVFGRVTPSQKSGLIKAMKARGHTVAMTGDGVNDVLALKESDCGVAMASGSDAARQVAQMALLDSDFASLPAAMTEGRRVVNNITNVAGVFFIKTIYSVLLALFSIFTFTAFPFFPIQITLIDLAIEAYPSFFLSLEPSGERIKGAFLPSVIKMASPYAVLILINIIIVKLTAPVIGLPEGEALSVMYYAVGFTSLMAVARACRPFNKLRAFLAVTAAAGFYAAIYLFGDILSLSAPSEKALAFFALIAVFSVFAKSPLTFAAQKIYGKIYKI